MLKSATPYHKDSMGIILKQPWLYLLFRWVLPDYACLWRLTLLRFQHSKIIMPFIFNPADLVYTNDDWMHIWILVSTVRTVKHWNTLPRDSVLSLSLEVFKDQLDNALSKLVWSHRCPCAELNFISLFMHRVPSNLNYLMALRLLLLSLEGPKLGQRCGNSMARRGLPCFINYVFDFNLSLQF